MLQRRALLLLVGGLLTVLGVIGVSFARPQTPMVDCTTNDCNFLPLILSHGNGQATVTPSLTPWDQETIFPTFVATPSGGTPTPSYTNTPTTTATQTATQTATNTPTQTATETPTNTATATETATQTATQTATSTATTTPSVTPVACGNPIGTLFPTTPSTATPLAVAPNSLTWSTAVPTPKSYPHWITEGQAAVVNNRLYVFGGFGGVSPSGDTPTRCSYVYDPALNTWTRLPDLPKGLTHAGTATDGRYIYIVGGYVEDDDGVGQKFSDNAARRFDTWTWKYDEIGQLPAFRGAGFLYYLPGPRTINGVSYPQGSLHYVSGTEWKSADKPEHYVYDLSKPPTNWPYWKKLADLPTPRQHAGGAVLNDKLYYIGGQEKHDGSLILHDEVHVYDPATNTWTQLASIPLKLNHISHSTIAIGNEIFVFAGQIKHNSFVNTVYAYNPATNTWRQVNNNLPRNSYSGIAAEINGQIIYTTGNMSNTYRGIPNN